MIIPQYIKLLIINLIIRIYKKDVFDALQKNAQADDELIIINKNKNFIVENKESSVINFFLNFLEMRSNSTIDAGSNENTDAMIVDKVIEFLIKPHHKNFYWGDRLLSLDKSCSFLSDPMFQKTVKSFKTDTGKTQYNDPNSITWRYCVLIWAARQACKVEGHFIELGVFDGDMSWVMTEMVDISAYNKKLYLYDTFAGFSKKYTSYSDFPDRPSHYDYLNQIYADPLREERVRARFRDKNNVIIIKGIVPDVLSEQAPDKVSFIHIDLNSAQPEIMALEKLWSKISEGGIILFDDYGWDLHKNQQNEHNSFMRAHGIEILELPTGQGLCIKH